MLDRYDQDLLLDYIEGELDADRRAQLESVLEDDPQLAALLHDIARDRAALRDLPQAHAPEDLVQDVTQTLERRMLLDDSVADDGPIPMSRGRGLSTAPSGGIRWGRVVGLTGLAAAVALAASVVVITFDDPLERTAEQLAANPPANETNEANEGDEESNAQAAEPGVAEPVAQAESRSRRESTLDAAPRDRSANSSAGDAATPRQPDEKSREEPEDLHRDESLALGPKRSAPAASAATAPELADARVAFDDEREGDDAAVPGRADALAAIQPRQQLVLLSEAPEISREQLLTFCVNQGIPIVQADPQPVAPGGPREREAAGAVAYDDLAAKDTADAWAGGYALLIDEQQLDALVAKLNTDITIEPKLAGKSSVVSNQAALLTELPTRPHREKGDADKAAPDDADNAPLARAVVEEAAPLDERLSQQAFALRLPPDLGSDYANSRNAYNLTLTQQRRAALRPEDDKPATAPPATTAPTPAADAHRDSAEAPTPDPEALTAPQAQAEPRRAAKLESTPPAAVDPTRGNWLAAHLPLPDTTPLLRWRTDQAASPTLLIAVTIQRADADKVNTLRLRQQTEQPRPQRANQPHADEQDHAEAQPDEPANAPPADTPPSE